MSEPLFRMIVDFEVFDVDGFRALAELASEYCRAESGTLVYEWYLDEETGRARLHEAYESFEALDAHVQGRVFTELGPRFFEVARFEHIDFYGDMPAERAQSAPLAPRTIWGRSVASKQTSDLDDSYLPSRRRGTETPRQAGGSLG